MPPLFCCLSSLFIILARSRSPSQFAHFAAAHTPSPIPDLTPSSDHMHSVCCRKLTRAFVAAEPERRAVASLLPPSHPLVDRIRTRIEVCPPKIASSSEDASQLPAGLRGALAMNTAVERDFLKACSEPSAKEQEEAHELLEQLQAIAALGT